jgi:hypothetical protein
MLTAAVRDLHLCYPGQFVTDVRTPCSELWENNPHIIPLSDKDPEAEHLDCSYPLIDRCNEAPYHCLHGFIEFLNDYLQLSIKPTAFKGDIHLSEQERIWYSQVHEVTRTDLPFWIVAAGGKYDVTIKWWDLKRYQQVVDHFRGKIQFVQVGDQGNHHPKLDGVIDLRGQTSLRELIRLVYHSQGVLCSVTALMHLAAAVPAKPGLPRNRACVVVAGGREPAHWEAYPGHQFIHTIGALPCCSEGGCWKDRTSRLRDGDKRDKRDHLCADVLAGLPRCMDMITAEEVIRRTEMYFKGGTLQYLSPTLRMAAKRGVAATRKNSYDQQSLNLHNAGTACDQFIERLPPYTGGYQSRGIVICGGGVSYFTNAWVCINMLRRSGCRLPVQLWHLGEKEIDDQMKALLASLRVECIDACKVRKQSTIRRLAGWELKPYAILHSPFREVLLLDADNVPVVNPEFLFETPQFQTTGAIFWPDYDHGKSEKAIAIWRSCGLRQPREPEFETGQIVVDKERCWRALNLCMWFNDNSDFYYQYLHGDKETFHLAFRKLKRAYSLVQKPIHPLKGTMCQHDFEGRRIFQHRNMDKWDLFLRNKQVNDFWFEQECRSYVAALQNAWDGGMSLARKNRTIMPVVSRRINKPVKIEAIMVSCAERKELRQQTLENLAETDWNDAPVHIRIVAGDENNSRQRQTQGVFSALKESLKRKAEYVLLFEDDLVFNRRIRHNVQNWEPVKTRTVTLAGLYNSKVRDIACDLKNNLRVVDPNSIFGSQTFLISRNTIRYLLRHWNELEGTQAIKISRLAARLRNPIMYHAPSLVNRIGIPPEIWDENFYLARDFDPDWAA